MKFFWTCLFLTILIACREDKSVDPIVEIPPLFQEEIPVEKKIKKALETDYLHAIGVFNENDQLYLNRVYKSNNYTPFWVNDSTRLPILAKLDSILKTPEKIGLPRNWIPTIESDNYLNDEIKTTLALSHIFSLLKNGLIDFEEDKRRTFHYLEEDTLLHLMQFHDSLSIFDQVRSKFFEDSNYTFILNDLSRFLDKHPLDTNTYTIRSIKYDTLDALTQTRKALISKNYLSDTVKDSVLISKGLQDFQKDNMLKPDGVIGKFTAQSLNESTYRKVLRVLVGLDKYRKPVIRPNKYIYINLPEYKLRYYAHDTLRSEHNIVIGKQENETPELTAKLRKIVVYPYWFVPYSISSGEILPSAKWNTGYFEKHNYVILNRKKDTINPYTVNWKKIRRDAFPYRVIQQPGPKNSLGIIKFDFYNKHSVFFHDTPAKSLFGVDVRSYSHGCMRTQNPVDLAKEILFRDSLRDELNPIQADSLDSLFSLEMNYEVKLLDPVKIFVEYHTVTSKDGHWAVYHDIYGRDEKHIKILQTDE